MKLRRDVSPLTAQYLNYVLPKVCLVRAAAKLNIELDLSVLPETRMRLHMVEEMCLESARNLRKHHRKNC